MGGAIFALADRADRSDAHATAWWARAGGRAARSLRLSSNRGVRDGRRLRARSLPRSSFVRSVRPPATASL